MIESAKIGISVESETVAGRLRRMVPEDASRRACHETIDVARPSGAVGSKRQRSFSMAVTGKAHWATRVPIRISAR